MGKKCHLSDFECAMGVGDRQDGLSISETAGIFPHIPEKRESMMTQITTRSVN